jgi:hypothetical protein
MKFLKVSKAGKFIPVKKKAANESHPTAINYEIRFSNDGKGGTNVNINVDGKCTGIESTVLGNIVKSSMKGNIVGESTQQTQAPFSPDTNSVSNPMKERARKLRMQNEERARRERESQ